jgi:hypothetical protein
LILTWDGVFWAVQFSGYLARNIIKCVCPRKFARVNLSLQIFVLVLAYHFTHQWLLSSSEDIKYALGLEPSQDSISKVVLFQRLALFL